MNKKIFIILISTILLNTPIITMQKYNNTETFSTAIRRIRENFNNNELYTTIKNKNHILVESLLKGGVNPNIMQPNGETALINAISEGSYKTVNLLLEYGANPRIYIISQNEEKKDIRIYPEDKLYMPCRSPKEPANLFFIQTQRKYTATIHAALLYKRLESLERLEQLTITRI